MTTPRVETRDGFSYANKYQIAGGKVSLITTFESRMHKVNGDRVLTQRNFEHREGLVKSLRSVVPANCPWSSEVTKATRTRSGATVSTSGPFIVPL